MTLFGTQAQMLSTLTSTVYTAVFVLSFTSFYRKSKVHPLTFSITLAAVWIADPFSSIYNLKLLRPY